MTDKQQQGHAQAKYWNGFITRVEAQKVFDETAQVVNAQALAMQKFDAVIACIAEKVGVTPADVNEWLKKKGVVAKTPHVYECLCGPDQEKHQHTCVVYNKRRSDEVANSYPIDTALHGKSADHEPKRIIEA